ncbi:amiloride-sensitive sodium channel subunit alpha-like [Mytilus trossulus]|uniref:amiloride-sensitive sodium channel subunit alpha-like n=1 Tax=Mytilus trossulus TaxID=6551 RepID=UPI003003B2B8
MNETGENMVDKKDKSLTEDDSYSEIEIWTNFTQTTGFHGLNKITFMKNNPRQMIRSICWIIVWLICAVFLIYTVVVELKNYYSYPTISNTFIQLEEKLSFPAVTICNMSPRSSQGMKKDAKTNNLHMTTSAFHSLSSGVKVAVHDHLVEPIMTNEGLVIKPASEANLGGQLGLFLGASILTITELLEFIIFLIWSFIHRVKKKRKNDQRKTLVEIFKPTKY